MRRPFSVQIIGKVYCKYNGKCAKCKREEDLHIHHLDLNHSNNQIENLVLLCKFCHRLIHSKEGNRTYYDEENINEYIDNFEDYTHQEFDWGVDSDCTDHFSFICPRCKSIATVDKIEVRNYDKDALRICPCFYFYLKCNKCKIKGQRKSYLNPELLEKAQERWERRMTKNKEDKNGDTKTTTKL